MSSLKNRKHAPKVTRQGPKKSSYVKLADIAPMWLDSRQITKRKGWDTSVAIWADNRQDVERNGKSYTAETKPGKHGWTICYRGRVYNKVPIEQVRVITWGKDCTLLSINGDAISRIGIVLPEK